MFKIFFIAPQPLACDGDGDVNLEAKKHALTVDGDSEEKGKRSNVRFTNGAHLVVVVMLRQKGKRSKVTFDKGCTGGCSPS